MGLASKIVRENLAIPGEPSEWVTLRAVSDKKLREAARELGTEQSRSYFLSLKGVPSDVLKTIETLKANVAVEKTEGAAAGIKPADKYDWDMLCRSAIIAWSYSDKPTPEEIADLTSDTKEWIVGQILEMSGQSSKSEDDGKNS